MRGPILGLLLASFASAAWPYDAPSGQLTFLEQCPGDKVAPAAASTDEALVAALLTPLLTGAINQGLKATGAHLKEIAAEQQVDALHTGDYFYQAAGEVKDGLEDLQAPNGIELRRRCLLLTSRGSADVKGSLRDLTTAYEAASVQVGKIGDFKVTSWFPAAASLEEALSNLGYRNTARPGLIVVFDLELASTAGAARLVPRFAVLDHSIREKKSDRYARDMTVELNLRLPGSTAPFAKALVKFEGMKTGVGVRRHSTQSGVPIAGIRASQQLTMTGDWFQLPALDAEAAARVVATAEADKRLKDSIAAYGYAAVEARANGAQDVPSTATCDTRTANRDAWLKAAAELQQATLTNPKNELTIASRTKAVAFFEACGKYNESVDAKKKSRLVRKRADKTQAAEALLVFDADAQVKEFRKRPVAEFFGNLLSDDTVRSGVTTGVLGAIDPGTRDAKSATEQAAALKLKGEFEVALVAAESAGEAYSSAKPEDKAAKLIELESKRRAANRIAEQMKVALPYPSSGTWLILGPT